LQLSKTTLNKVNKRIKTSDAKHQRFFCSYYSKQQIPASPQAMGPFFVSHFSRINYKFARQIIIENFYDVGCDGVFCTITAGFS